MRKRVFKATLGFCLLIAVATATAFAQDLPGPFVRATIPFDFYVRGKTFPAGDYEIKRVYDNSPNLLLISNLKNHERTVFETENVELRALPKRGEIAFHRYGDSYFLSEIFAGGDQSGCKLLPSRQERKLRSEMASNRSEPETVAVAVY